MVRCRDCGLLGVRYDPTGEMCEADEFFRANGHGPRPIAPGDSFGIGGHSDLRSGAVCAAGKGVFSIDEFGPETRAERECDAFVQWQRGWTPKEHQEMMFHQALLESQREEKEREREWREKMEALRAAREDARDRREDLRDRRQLVALIIAGIGLASGPILAWFLAWFFR